MKIMKKIVLLTFIVPIVLSEKLNAMTILAGAAAGASIPCVLWIRESWINGRAIHRVENKLDAHSKQTTENFVEVKKNIQTANTALDILTQAVAANHTISQASHTTTQVHLHVLEDAIDDNKAVAKKVGEDLLNFSSATTITLADIKKSTGESASYLDLLRANLIPALCTGIETINKKSDDILDRLKALEALLPSLATKDDLSQMGSKISEQVTNTFSEQIAQVLTKLDKQGTDAEKAFSCITKLNSATIAGIFAMNTLNKKQTSPTAATITQ